MSGASPVTAIVNVDSSGAGVLQVKSFFPPETTEDSIAATTGSVEVIFIANTFEEIFGEIKDEFDTEDAQEQKLGSNHYRFDARLEIDYLNEKYAWNLPEGDFETLSGFILSQTENLPNIGETITYGRFTFTIVSKQAHRIETVRLKISDSANL